MSYDYCTLWVLGLIRLDRTGGHTHFSESETELFGNKLEWIFIILIYTGNFCKQTFLFNEICG